MSQRVTRRQFGVGAIASTAFAQQGGDTHPRIDGATRPDLDPVAWTKTRHDSAPLRLTFNAQSKQAAEAWQIQLRGKVTELLGGFPAERTALHPQTLEVREFPNYRREKFLFQSRPGVGVVGYLLLPANAPKPVPAVICIPGHGRGVEDIVGIDEHGNDRTDKAGYQHDYAIRAAEHGMAAVAIEPMAFGYRRDAITEAKGPSITACQPTAGSAFLLGETMIGWRVYDTMRAIDWIETRAELDHTRVGCMGISGGGTCTLFASALEPRIRAAFVSGYLNTFRDSIMSVSHCIDNYVPSILNWAEQYDVAGLIAPRPLFAESGSQDPIFPIAASRASFARVQHVYEIFGARENVGHEIFEGDHHFHGVRGLPFLARALGLGDKTAA